MVHRTALIGLALAFAPVSRAAAPEPAVSPACALPIAQVEAPKDVVCANALLTGYDGLLVLAPHPDDEVLAFAGLIDSYLRQGKRVEVVIVTDGDAYCDACGLWKNGSLDGPLCGASDLSNFATPEVDSFAEMRRLESAKALSVIGAPPPTFLGYPDTGLASAWEGIGKRELATRLRRSDFSSCESCGPCSAGYGAGPETALSPVSLLDSLSRRVAGTTSRTLVATTHWLDGHADHAALGQLVRQTNAAQEHPRPVAFAVVHAHTPKSASHADCWHPGPAASLCACAVDECTRRNASWVSQSRAHRFRPTWPAVAPDDADYGSPQSLCLASELYEGEAPRKLQAVESYRSQLGFAARDDKLPERLAGVLDCSGYLISFVRRTEILYLLDSANGGK
jgi:LmbE family N-acetylglucosaminyl deacetylase